MDRRGFGAPFEYEYHFIEYEYERAFLTALIPGEPENKKSPHGGVPSGLVSCWREDRSSNSGARSVTDREGPGRRPPLFTKTYSWPVWRTNLLKKQETSFSGYSCLLGDNR